jgi:hypothetical protein
MRMKFRKSLMSLDEAAFQLGDGACEQLATKRIAR